MVGWIILNVQCSLWLSRRNRDKMKRKHWGLYLCCSGLWLCGERSTQFPQSRWTEQVHPAWIGSVEKAIRCFLLLKMYVKAADFFPSSKGLAAMFFKKSDVSEKNSPHTGGGKDRTKLAFASWSVKLRSSGSESCSWFGLNFWVGPLPHASMVV